VLCILLRKLCPIGLMVIHRFVSRGSLLCCGHLPRVGIPTEIETCVKVGRIQKVLSDTGGPAVNRRLARFLTSLTHSVSDMVWLFVNGTDVVREQRLPRGVITGIKGNRGSCWDTTSLSLAITISNPSLHLPLRRHLSAFCPPLEKDPRVGICHQEVTRGRTQTAAMFHGFVLTSNSSTHRPHLHSLGAEILNGSTGALFLFSRAFLA